MEKDGFYNSQALGVRLAESKESVDRTTVLVKKGTAVKKKYIPPHRRQRLQESQRWENEQSKVTSSGRNNIQGQNSFSQQQFNRCRVTSQRGGGVASHNMRDTQSRNQAASSMIPNDVSDSPTKQGMRTKRQSPNRFSKNNLYERSGNGANGNHGGKSNNSVYRSPNSYNPHRRLGYGPQAMRRQRDYEYTNQNRFYPGDRSIEANPDLELELFGKNVVTQGINFDIYDKIPVEISGQNCPKPIDNFKESNLPHQILENIKHIGFAKPTPVQRYSIPCGLQARDLMSCAQTGSGKTAAFLVPIIARLIMEGRAEEVLSKSPQRSYGYGSSSSRSKYDIHSLVLSPTRELAQQIHKQARKFLYRTGLRSVVVYGGSDIKIQFKELDRGCEVLVATPGRLEDFLERGRMSLAKVLCFCLDEADRMLDMGFEPQIRKVVECFDMPRRHQGRQTMMFSATFPQEIQVLAQEYLNDYVFLAVGRVGSSTDLIEQKLQYCQNHNKIEALMDVLPDCHGLTLIFVATRRDADRIENILCEEGVNARSIHGDRSQWEREEALRDFRNGTYPVLVATDVAARGLDIPSVMWVINYDLPNQIDSYVHRIGRTGRCGNRGNALSFVNESNKPVLRDLLHTLRECNMTLPQWFVNMVNNTSFGSGGRKKKGSRFGARDARRGNKGNNFGGNRGGYQNRNNKGGYTNRRGGHGGGYNRNGSNASRTKTNDAW